MVLLSPFIDFPDVTVWSTVSYISDFHLLHIAVMLRKGQFQLFGKN